MISVRKSWLYKFVNERRGGIPGLVKSWETLRAKPPVESTLWRWLTDKVDIPSSQIMSMAGVLNLDPFALFEATQESFEWLCLRLMQSVASPSRGRLNRDFEWVSDLIAPSSEWPSKHIASDYFHREWQCTNFHHAARDTRNYYQKLKVTVGRQDFTEPQVWHFAFRAPTLKHPIWRPYGFVIREQENVELYTLRGSTAQLTLPANTKSFVVETWFGLGPAEFRVASLHRFALALVPDTNNDPLIRFPES